ncbi:hypothetical protein I4F81_010042 [Pyropia yezoensis]|uniref:Uncharacterized protein n=1 Tax=Pyropia yezoensis TaxID=2788 RepID=A0ACC3CBR5_PYRYE|nr:hypothetical protein I4F81_010042 [Neopyropia yezoensis]
MLAACLLDVGMGDELPPTGRPGGTGIAAEGTAGGAVVGEGASTSGLDGADPSAARLPGATGPSAAARAELDEVKERLRRLLLLEGDGPSPPQQPNEAAAPAAPGRVDARFLAYFKLGSAGKQAAASAYKVAAWAQDLSNAALSLYYERDDSSAAKLADRHAGAAIGARELVANTIAHYNYLE